MLAETDVSHGGASNMDVFVVMGAPPFSVI